MVFLYRMERKLKVRVKEHRSGAEKVSEGTVYIRDRKRQSQSEMWGSESVNASELDCGNIEEN